jgi:CRISPR system Cascade subunit CasE
MSSWLTRIVVNPRHRGVRADLHDAHRMHCRLMSLFPDDLGSDARHRTGLLYRLETTRTGDSVVLAQSTLQPDPSRLPAGYGTTQYRPLTPMLDALTGSMQVRYRLAANASKRAWKGDDKHRPGQIVALSGDDAAQWWRDRASHHGLHLHTLQYEPVAAARGERDSDTIRHSITRFDGIAEIRDPHAVRAAVLAGIGRGKTYGCGLLSLAPVRP